MGLFGYTLIKDSDIEKEALGDRGTGQDAAHLPLYDDEMMALLAKANRESVGALVSDLRQGATDRKKRFDEYRKAKKDPVIGQAVEMMADDATQFSVERESTVWVESDDKGYADAINGILHDYLEPFVDTVASAIVSKGEFAFRHARDEAGERGRYADIPLVPMLHVENLHQVALPGRERVFCEVAGGDELTEGYLGDDPQKRFHPYSDYLHFINYSLDNSREMDIRSGQGPGGGKTKKKVLILQGEAIISEKVLEVQRILTALEDSMTRYRLSKSRLVRFATVDIARLTNKNEIQNIVNYVRSSVASSEAVGPDGMTPGHVPSRPTVITVPVRNGVGAIDVKEFASDVNVKDIADVEYFVDQKFAALRTPKAYLNYGDVLPGMGASGASLTKMDNRYARATMKVQRVLIKGVHDLVSMFNEANGITDPPKYKVGIVKVASAEDYDRYTELEQKMATSSQMVSNLLDPSTGEVNMKAVDAYRKYFTHVVRSDEVVRFLDSLTKRADIKAKPDGVRLTGYLS
jgi:hypothetical protein